MSPGRLLDRKTDADNMESSNFVSKASITIFFYREAFVVICNVSCKSPNEISIPLEPPVMNTCFPSREIRLVLDVKKQRSRSQNRKIDATTTKAIAVFTSRSIATKDGYKINSFSKSILLQCTNLCTLFITNLNFELEKVSSSERQQSFQNGHHK